MITDKGFKIVKSVMIYFLCYKPGMFISHAPKFMTDLYSQFGQCIFSAFAYQQLFPDSSSILLSAPTILVVLR